MRVRTQPFRVGGVLEAPPSYLVLNEKPGEWETRGLTPNSNLGDPIAGLDAESARPLRVLTFVSHSFQLLRRYDSEAPEDIEAFVQRFRSDLPVSLAERHLGAPLRAVRTFGEEVDGSLVAAVTDILRRVADRPDARCVTYAELAAAADRFWPLEQHPPVDPLPLFDRNEGVAGISGTRVFGPGLLTHLASRSLVPRSSEARGEADRIPGWEDCGASEFRRRLGDRAAELGAGETLRLRLRTLGVAPPDLRGSLPPLAEVLFPVAAIGGVAEEVGAGSWRGLPWDAATFRAWLEWCGFEILDSRTVPRPAGELARLAPFAEKLDCLDRGELETEALEVELRPATAAPQPLPDAVDPAFLPAAAAALYDSMHPGEGRCLRIFGESSPATRTTRILSLMRAGLEIVGREGDEYRLLRPLDLSDIRRFAGL